MDNETPETEDEYWLNPKSGRYLKVGGKTHKRLMKQMKAVKVDTPEETPRENVKVEDVRKDQILRHRLMVESANMVKENMHKLKDVEYMSQDELDETLKRLLVEKLGLRTPPPSSDESSDSSDSSD